ncbi:ATP-dependent DNA helicase RecG [Blattabacterium cuenoti]|uniref:ATP-dependent DNA helicase RecG n=1 Tax=Blattabacterium cuenoti TaxID=1653831 RepID=UPI00163BF5C3|nr:ATP-dependent DNA helicase RecG [Blattabacterium cuenoti]
MSCKNILKKSIEHLKGLSSIKINLLNSELNIYTYEDFLFFYPKKYIFYSFVKKISELSNTKICNNLVQILGIITNTKEIDYKNKQGKIVIARLEDETGFIELIWFRKTYFLKNLRKNIKVIVSGKIIIFQKKIQIIHPNIQNLQNYKKIISIYPVYNISKKLKKKGIDNFLIRNILLCIIKKLNNNNINIGDFCFQNYVKKQLMSRKLALIQIHFPISFKKLLQAKYSLKFEELFILKLFFLSKKKISYSRPFNKIGEKFNMFYKYFMPFDLTNGQKKVFREIWNDLKKPIQMKRLLQGDVGSGKTIIAILSILTALDNGFQSCFMAPTEILAVQHYYYIKKIFSKIGINTVLLTGSVEKSIRKDIYNKIYSGKISVIIGTHALIYKKVIFNNLGLLVIDEEQRFGVEQREKICKQCKFLPHVLIMTATPIPRTLAKAIYNDLNISILENLPKGRKSIKTIHCFSENRDKAFEIIKNQLLEGKQIYIVYPIINESKINKYTCLINGYEKIKEKFKNIKNEIGILHGEMNIQEKEIQMKQFLNGKTKIITTTTVIEVGIDVPNATVILIENANFFGLSQLHQLRGRVGRSIHQSYCILITEKKISIEGILRMKKMCSTNDGLEIAKEDLKLRGSGNLIGTEQSGKDYFKIVNFSEDLKIIKEIIPIAKKFFEKNPNFLRKEKHIFQRYYKKNKIQSLFINE